MYPALCKYPTMKISLRKCQINNIFAYKWKSTTAATAKKADLAEDEEDSFDSRVFFDCKAFKSDSLAHPKMALSRHTARVVF